MITDGKTQMSADYLYKDLTYLFMKLKFNGAI